MPRNLATFATLVLAPALLKSTFAFAPAVQSARRRHHVSSRQQRRTDCTDYFGDNRYSPRRPPSQIHMGFEPLSTLLSDLTAPPPFVDNLIAQVNQVEGGWIDKLAVLATQISSELSTAHIRTAGETVFAASLVVALAQGALIMYQYASNPRGGLMVPPGLTVGDEDASSNMQASAYQHQQQVGAIPPPSMDQLCDLVDDAACGVSPEDSEACRTVKKGWYYVSQIMLPMMVPWLATQCSFALLRYGHILHMAVILGLAHVYDFFKKLPDMQQQLAASPGWPVQDSPELEETFLASDHPRVVVLGDSMAVGIGCVEQFDSSKGYDIPLHKEERLHLDGAASDQAPQGPIFPQMLARTLSERLGKPVAWRSAGCDGGDAHDIREHLMSVIQDEVDKGHYPDAVVILTGSNDLKHILNVGNEEGRSASVRGFRKNLMELAQDIQRLSPNTKIVLPSLPTCRLDPSSILNVFPLSFFLDGIIGFWDAQTSHVAQQCPGVMHVDLKVKDVNQWYVQERLKQPHGGQAPTMISADGIHPNAKCYAKWGTYVGNRLADTVEVEENSYNNRMAVSLAI